MSKLRILNSSVFELQNATIKAAGLYVLRLTSRARIERDLRGFMQTYKPDKTNEKGQSNTSSHFNGSPNKTTINENSFDKEHNRPKAIIITGGTDSKPSQSNGENKPTEEQIKIGDDTLKDIWEFCQDILQKLNKLEVIIGQKQDDLVLTSYNILKTTLNPVKVFIKENILCQTDVLISKIDKYLNTYKLFFRDCRRSNYSKSKFHNIVNSVTNYLDQLQIHITKKVSICEQLNSKNAKNCYLETRNNAEKYKTEFSKKHLIKIEKDADEIGDEIESYWLGFIIKYLSGVKKTGERLQWKLNSFNQMSDDFTCNELQEDFDKILQFTEYVTDFDDEEYYLEAKHKYVINV